MNGLAEQISSTGCELGARLIPFIGSFQKTLNQPTNKISELIWKKKIQKNKTKEKRKINETNRFKNNQKNENTKTLRTNQQTIQNSAPRAHGAPYGVPWAPRSSI